MTKPRQIPFDLPHLPSRESADFFVSGSNRMAADLIDKWPDWQGNALIIEGPKAAGKSHLCAIWCERSGAAMFRGELPDLTVISSPVAIDDADKLADAKALLHLYNWCGEHHFNLLLTASLPTDKWCSAGLADLSSRLKATPRAPISEPDDALLAAVLTKQFADRQLDVSQKLIQYLLPRTERSLAAIAKLVEALDRASLAERTGISTHLARRVLEDIA